MRLQVRLERLLKRAAIVLIFPLSRTVSCLYSSSLVSRNADDFTWLCDGKLFFQLQARRLATRRFFHVGAFGRRKPRKQEEYEAHQDEGRRQRLLDVRPTY